MERRVLGRTGVRISRFGLGTMVLGAWGNQDRAACIRIVHRAIDAGINLVDTADVYAFGESEEIVGEALRGRRDDVVLATKFNNAMSDEPNHRGNSRRWIVRSVEDSLRRLGTDHIDLYQVHRPDPATDLEETIDALTDLVRAGKIRYWGTSTFPAADLVEACWVADRRGVARPHSEQPPYSILCRGVERDVLPACQRFGIGVMTWAPLAGGWLTGKYRPGEAAPAGSRGATHPDHFDGANDVKFRAVDLLTTIAADAGLPLAHLALAWTVEHPAVTACLLGVRTETQLDDLLAAAHVVLPADALDAIDDVVPPGVDLNPADAGWTPPALDRSRRRRGTTFPAPPA